ncbi:hypothetical protein [Corallococcus exercitus]|uniref:hypothetical protein n=1 Tax=Corallococcus exercitus TaxID=2316736 RepID=UPI0035D4EAE7
MKISRPPSSPPTSPTTQKRPSVPEPVPPKPPSEASPSDIFDKPVIKMGPGGQRRDASGSSIKVGSGSSRGSHGLEERDKLKEQKAPGSFHPRKVPNLPGPVPPRHSEGCGGEDTNASGSSVRAGGRGSSSGTQGDHPGTPPRTH